MKSFIMSKLVKSEDLNHHGTLFAGRMAEWFIEGGFIAAASTLGRPDSLVCKKLHGLTFALPVNKGEIIKLEAKVVLVGTTSMRVYGKVTKINEDKTLVDGFITFVCVDEEGKKIAHNLPQFQATSKEDIELVERAKAQN